MTPTEIFSVHSRTRYGVYIHIGKFSTLKQAYKALAVEVGRGVTANAWIASNQVPGKLALWDHEFDTIQDAANWVLVRFK